MASRLDQRSAGACHGKLELAHALKSASVASMCSRAYDRSSLREALSYATRSVSTSRMMMMMICKQKFELSARAVDLFWH
ncbi:hypothetical protein HYQ46_000580 [Verticillium longisporum]|nr:hypothetical protein HYQ46_000580 [Verticillium longisporum]